MNSFYTKEELEKLGLKICGKNVLISRKASIYGAENITIGSHVRIDDFCILSGNIKIGNYVHISAYTALYGGSAGIVMKDFSGISSRCIVYALSDDFSGQALTNPMVEDKYRNVTNQKVIIEKHVLIGTGCTILPGVHLNEGVSIGACSLVNNDCSEWGIYIGIPARRFKDRSKNLLNLERKMLNN